MSKNITINSFSNNFPWGRKIQIRFYEMSETGELGNPLPQVLDGLRTTVNYKATWGAGNDSCLVEVYNMYEEVEVGLRKYQDKLAIQVYAGYTGSIVGSTTSNTDSSATANKASSPLDTDVDILFTGVVNTFYSRKNYTERITSFMCIPHSSKFYMKDISYTAKGKDVAQVAEGLAAKAGWIGTQGQPLVTYHSIPDSLLHRPMGSITFEGSFADCISRFAEQTHLQIAGRMDGLHIYMQNKVPFSVAGSTGYIPYEQTVSKEDASKVYFPDVTDLKSVPVRSTAQLNMLVRFKPLMMPGSIINTTILTGGKTDSSGVQLYLGGLIDYKGIGDVMYRQNIFNSFIDTQYYLCQGAEHRLDTHGDDWDTEFVATASVKSISDPAAHYYEVNSGRY